MILHYAGEDAVREIARHRLQLVGSDGIFGPRPHPRLWGTAPRFLGRYALREGLIPVEEAVARLTARAADLLGLSDRGRVAPGLRADPSCSTPSASSIPRPMTTRAALRTASSASGSPANACGGTALRPARGPAASFSRDRVTRGRGAGARRGGSSPSRSSAARRRTRPPAGTRTPRAAPARRPGARGGGRPSR